MLNDSQEIQTAPASESGFIDETEMLKRIPISRGTLINYRKSGKIPFVHLGGRRILFHWPTVETALLRLQTGCSL